MQSPRILMRVQTLHDRLLEAARAAGFQGAFYGETGDWSLPVFTRAGDPGALHIYLSAGVHGDEPAGPLALLHLIRKRLLPEGPHYSLVPLVNPRALEAGTRETPEGVDVNRDYGPQPASAEARLHKAWLGGQRFDLALCLHEDTDAAGFYLYELCAPGHPSLAAVALAASRAHMPTDTRREIDGMPACGGQVYPPAEAHARERTDLPEALCLFFEHTDCCLTLETPTRAPAAQRMETQVAVILSLIGAFSSPTVYPRRQPR
ncbi:MAG: M14 family metallocarboxypeptidase [Opitutales bacterium]|nr:M14 family metallocarboxypeptidase [Opitutales bacterium]